MKAWPWLRLVFNQLLKINQFLFICLAAVTSLHIQLVLHLFASPMSLHSFLLLPLSLPGSLIYTSCLAISHLVLLLHQSQKHIFTQYTNTLQHTGTWCNIYLKIIALCEITQTQNYAYCDSSSFVQIGKSVQTESATVIAQEKEDLGKLGSVC